MASLIQILQTPHDILFLYLALYLVVLCILCLFLLVPFHFRCYGISNIFIMPNTSLDNLAVCECAEQQKVLSYKTNTLLAPLLVRFMLYYIYPASAILWTDGLYAF